jgi:SAM-dependent methyltransferase
VNPQKLLGQVYTPDPVADLTLALALDGAPDGQVLDPACGDGVFLARARAAGIAADRLRGIDIDPTAVAAARARRTGARVEHGDFLVGDPPRGIACVVGNPPYVRQELLGAAGKERIRAALATDWPALALSGRADLAMAFLARALRTVAPGGRVAFVMSAAVLDADYAGGLGALLEGRGRLVTVVGSPRERWFADAAVHGVIVVVERTTVPVETTVARLRVPVAEIAGRPLARVATLRRGPGPLRALLRAPDVWFELAPSLVPLRALAEVRRGLTSGANDFFYPPADAGLEPDVLVPLFKTPRQVDRILVDAGALATRAFVSPDPPPPGARRWIQAHRHLADRPTLRSRDPWWSLPVRPARLFLGKAYHARFVQPLTSVAVVPDQRVYAVTSRGVADDLLCAALNSTLAALALESLGRASLGQGALEWSVADAADLPVVDVRRVDPIALRRAFAPLAARPIGDVFAEATQPDRRALDALLGGPVEAIHAGLLEAVSERLARSTRADRRALPATRTPRPPRRTAADRR